MTEEVTGLDLVQWQLRIARGEKLDAPPLRTVTPSRFGSTPRTRARSCPRSGGSTRLRLPTSIRVDAGVAEGDEIGTSYDPLLAKLIASGRPAPRRSTGSRRAGRDRGRGRDDEPAVPALAGRPSRAASRRGDDRVPRRAPAALAPHRPTPPAAVWRGPFRLNLPSPPPAAAPDEGAAAHLHGPAGAHSNLVTAPMPGTVLKVHVQRGLGRPGRRAARSSSRR